MNTLELEEVQVIEEKELSLVDFYNLQGMDMMEKASKFNSMLEKDVFTKRLFQQKIVACSPSAPVRSVKDVYSGHTKQMFQFASNDYLNLANHPKVVEAGVEAVRKYGAGPGSAPLLGGAFEMNIELEQRIAKFKHAESALVYPVGFSSNSSTLISLLQKDDLAILDMLVHASIVDGCKNTNLKHFKHNDIASLEMVLKKTKGEYRTRLVIVDGVYSMDGDIAPLDQIVALAKYYGAYVMIDDAHSTGVLGENGRGTSEYFGVEGQVDIISGTFSKALGGVGGFIAAKKELVELLGYCSRGFMFSTAMAPQVCASVLAALDIIEQEPERRVRLWKNIRYFKNSLLNLGFNVSHVESAIFPIITGDDQITKALWTDLFESNIYVGPVLYPAVPKRLSRVRISLMADHTQEHLDTLLTVLASLGKKYDLI